MRKVTAITRLSLFCLLLLMAALKVNAQSFHPYVPNSYIFDKDSVQGFDEDMYKNEALQKQLAGNEYKAFMYLSKREFIKNKYSIVSPNYNNQSSKLHAVLAAACTNEDFEAAVGTSPVVQPIGTTSAVNGWTITGGTVGSSGSCRNLSTCCSANPNAVDLINPGANGYQDPIIGASYKIWSVFGNTTTTYPAATTANGFQCFGDWFIRINNSIAGASVHKLSKSFSVTPSNALFQFAFISVIQGAHCCCDNAGFELKVTAGGPLCASASTLLSCPNFSASPPAGFGCTPTGSCVSAGNNTSYIATAGWYYNKWKLNTLDLTPYIGKCVTIDVMAFDCPWSGHAGYVYFDAQCSPMGILGNNVLYPAGTPSITLPTCGSGNTATITAPAGVGPYLWTGPGTSTVTGQTAQTIITGATGIYTLVMNPPGSCAPITRTINVIISPSPNMAVTSQTQASCSNSVNAVAIQCSSGIPIMAATPHYSVSFAPTPPGGTVAVAANSATYSTLSVGINTITVTDSVGCTTTTTINVTPLPQTPSFSISAPTGTVIGCNPSSITLNAVNTSSTLTNTTYTWSSISTGTQTGATNNNVQAPSGTNVYTITGVDYTAIPVSCPYTVTFAVSQNTTAPSVTVTPLTGAVLCNAAPICFTATSSPTLNIDGQWFGPGAVPIGTISASPIIMCSSSPGTYSVAFWDKNTGCITTKTISITSNTIVPSITITPSPGFTINCAVPCVSMAITADANIAPQSYSWTNVTTSVTTTPITGGYTICTPGQYIASFRDGRNCTVSQTITVMIDTLHIIPSFTTNIPTSNTLTCYNPTLTATAISSPMFAASSYSWIAPGPLTYASNTQTVGMANVTSSTSATNYTVLVQNPANGCIGRYKVPFYKDILVPNYTAVFTPTAITCANSCVFFSANLTQSQYSTTPVTYTFTSPAPTTTNNIPGSPFCVPGPYTMTYQNTLNGCTKVATNTVVLNVVPPATVSLAPKNIPCGQSTTIITAGTTTTSTSYSYTWDGPAGAGMCCMSSYSTTVNMPGIYEVYIVSSINGCSATNSVLVTSSSVIPVSFNASPTDGFAPLTVSFDNTTPFTSNTGTVSTYWNYGNGTTGNSQGLANTYSVTGFPDGGAVYQAAGTYTVLCVVSHTSTTGVCTGTAIATIKVELPSELTIPNVFSPNGDGINDEFKLVSTNLTEITCTIFDRWGVKMYDVKSDKGNIAWDGKNFGGKEVPVGTYFYILKATGKDGTSFEQKGTVSLYR